MGMGGQDFSPDVREKQQAAAHLGALEEALFARRLASRVVMGFRQRILVTRLGEACFRQRPSRDESGRYRLLLDEYLELAAYQASVLVLHGTAENVPWANQ
jgi:hypothetical protein